MLNDVIFSRAKMTQDCSCWGISNFTKSILFELCFKMVYFFPLISKESPCAGNSDKL